MPRYKNGIKLYDNRTDIINAFVYEDITTKNPEAKLYGDPEKQKSEIKFEESAVEEKNLMKKIKKDRTKNINFRSNAL